MDLTLGQQQYLKLICAVESFGYRLFLENMSENNAWKVFRPDEVALHNTKGDCWLIIDGKVYDISGFEHPGKAYFCY